MTEFGEPGIVPSPEIHRPPSFEQSMLKAGVPSPILDARHAESKDLLPELFDLELWALSGTDIKTIPPKILFKSNIQNADSCAASNSFRKIWERNEGWKRTQSEQLQERYNTWVLEQGSPTIAQLVGMSTATELAADEPEVKPPTRDEAAMIRAQATDEAIRRHDITPSELAFHTGARRDAEQIAQWREEAWTGHAEQPKTEPLSGEEYLSEVLLLCRNATQEAINENHRSTGVATYAPELFVLEGETDVGVQIVDTDGHYSSRIETALKEVSYTNDSLLSNPLNPRTRLYAKLAKSLTLEADYALKTAAGIEHKNPHTHDYRRDLDVMITRTLNRVGFGQTEEDAHILPIHNVGIVTARLAMEGIDPSLLVEDKPSESTVLKHVSKEDETHFDVEIAEGSKDMTGRMILLDTASQQLVEPYGSETHAASSQDKRVVIRIPPPQDPDTVVQPAIPGYRLSGTTNTDGKIQFSFEKIDKDPYQADIAFSEEEEAKIADFIDTRFPKALKKKLFRDKPTVKTLRQAVQLVKQNSEGQYADSTRTVQDPDDFIENGKLVGTCGVSAAFVQKMIQECTGALPTVITGIASDGVPHAQVLISKHDQTAIVDATGQVTGGHTHLPERVKKSMVPTRETPLVARNELIHTDTIPPIDPIQQMKMAGNVLSSYFERKMGIAAKKIPSERRQTLVVEHIAGMSTDDVARRTYQQIHRASRGTHTDRTKWTEETNQLKTSLHALIERRNKPADALIKRFGNYKPHELKMFLQALELAL